MIKTGLGLKPYMLACMILCSVLIISSSIVCITINSLHDDIINTETVPETVLKIGFENCNGYDNEINMARERGVQKIGTRSTRFWTQDAQLGGIDNVNLYLNQINPIVICPDDSNIYCLWEDDRGGDWNLYFTKSTNAGYSWSDDLLLTNDSLSLGNQRNSDIAVFPNEVSKLAVVWEDDRADNGDIYFSYSLDQGESWANDTKVNPDEVPTNKQWSPALAVDSEGSIFVVWMDDTNGNWDIKLSRSVDLGKTWSQPIYINERGSAFKDQIKPDICIDSDDNIYIFWSDNRGTDYQIYFSMSLDSGETFSSSSNIGSNFGSADEKEPCAVVDDNDNILITWLEDDNSRYNVYFTKSLDHGKSFSEPVRVNDDLDKCSPETNPVVDSDGAGFIYVAWPDMRDKNHIYLAYSTDTGRSFAVSEKIDDADNTSATGISVTTEEELWRGQVQVALTNNKVYVFWVDYRNDQNPDDGVADNGDIYLSWNSTLPNIPPTKPEFIKTSIARSWWFINISWKMSPDLDFQRYELHMSQTKDFTPNLATLNASVVDRELTYLNLSNLEPSRTYYFRLKVFDNGGKSNVSDQLIVTTKTNIPPTIDMFEPDGSIEDLVDDMYTITWEDNDPDDNANITLYYDTNQNPNDGRTLIGETLEDEDGIGDSYDWDTRMVPNGSYYISAEISDNINAEQFPIYSPGKLKIYHGNLDPWLTVVFISPKNASDVELTSSLIVIFNKRVDPATIHQDSFFVQDANNKAVPGEFSFDQGKTRVIFSPNNFWNGSTKYNVYLTRSIRDSTGMFKLNSDYNWWFETEVAAIKIGTIFGRVVDQYFGNPINGAVVTITDQDNKSNTINTTTDGNGDFSFTANYGTYKLNISAEGYYQPSPMFVVFDQEQYDLPAEYLARPVIIDFNIKSNIEIDEELKVSAQATHPMNAVLTYTWDFGDGQVLTGQNLTHKYSKSGIYVITLTVTDNFGGIDTKSESIKVDPETLSSDYILYLLGLIVLIIIIGLIIIFLALYKARSRRMEMQEKKKKQKGEQRVSMDKRLKSKGVVTVGDSESKVRGKKNECPECGALMIEGESECSECGAEFDEEIAFVEDEEDRESEDFEDFEDGEEEELEEFEDMEDLEEIEGEKDAELESEDDIVDSDIELAEEELDTELVNEVHDDDELDLSSKEDREVNEAMEMDEDDLPDTKAEMIGSKKKMAKEKASKVSKTTKVKHDTDGVDDRKAKVKSKDKKEKSKIKPKTKKIKKTIKKK